MLDILKVLFCMPFLLYSCYSDVKTRRVTDSVWLVMLAGGALFILYDFSEYGLAYLLRLFISAGLLFVFIYIYLHISEFFHVRAMGGADAKLLMVLSILFPVYPAFQALGHAFPLFATSNLFVLSVLGDAVAATMVIPLAFAVYNLAKMGLHIDKPSYIFIGYKTRISELAGKYIWINQDFEEKGGRIHTHYRRSGIENDGETIARLNALVEKGLIKDEVWVTPKLPFMIPLTLGFFVAAVYGDLIFELMRHLISS